MKGTKNTSENGGSVRDKSEDRATNFSDQDNDTKEDATEKDANKSFDHNKSVADSKNGRESDHLDDENDSDADETPVGKPKSKRTPKKRTKKNADNTINGKAGGKKKPKKKKGTTGRKSNTAVDEDTEEEYEVEKVTGKKKIGSKTYFLIRWKGYSAKDDTWEEESTLNCEELIKEYVEKGKKEPQQSRKRGLESPRRSKRVDYTEDEDEDEYQGFLSSTRKRQFSNATSASKGKRARQHIEEEDEEEYEVDKIIKVQNTKKGGREFLVRWKGYPDSQATWEPEKNLNCRDLLDRFLEKQKENHSPKNNKVSPKKKKRSASSAHRSSHAKRR